MIYFWFIIGTLIGSFLNVCIHRLPRGESIVFPPSHCPHCQRPLQFWDLFPILSYLYLRGKCRYCTAKIAIRYPLVELAMGLLVAFLWWQTQGAYPDFVFAAVFCSLLVGIFFIDLENQTIPDSLIASGVLLGLGYNLYLSWMNQLAQGYYPLISSVYGLLLGYLFFLVIGKIGGWFYKKEVIGEGDLFVAAMLGACLGWERALLAIFLSYILAAVVAVIFLLTNKVKFGQMVAFAPALVTGGLIAFFFGSDIIAWYMRTLWL